jgi:hypothetical protein
MHRHPGRNGAGSSPPSGSTGRQGQRTIHKPPQCLQWQRFREEIALRELTAERAQAGRLQFRLHALGDNGDGEALRQRQNGDDDLLPAARTTEIGNERAINLQKGTVTLIDCGDFSRRERTTGCRYAAIWAHVSSFQTLKAWARAWR